MTVQLWTVPLQLESMGPGVAVLFILVGTAVIAVFARRSVAKLRTVLSVDPRPVEQVEPGMVEIEGSVADAGRHSSTRTFSGHNVDPVVTQYRRSDGRGRDFSLPVPQQLAPDVLSESSAVPFYVEDDTGRVLVDAAYADVSLDSDHNRHSTLTKQTEVEAWLEPGDTVSVLGEAVPAETYAAQATPPGGIPRRVVRFLRGRSETTADEVLDDGELVVTRTSTTPEFLVADTTGTRTKLRQGLMAGFWTLSGLICILGGTYVLVSQLFGL